MCKVDNSEKVILSYKDNMEKKELDELRKTLGTLPALQPTRKDEWFDSCEAIRVKMIDGPKNYAKPLYAIATATWGDRSRWFDRWENATPEARLFVVQKVLERKTLPSAAESVNFSFNVDGVSRSAYDQIRTHRFLAFGSVGQRDNSWVDSAFIVPHQIYSNKSQLLKFKELTTKIKDFYQELVEQGQTSWQNARFILPMSIMHRFSVTGNFRAFQDVMSLRLASSEQFDSVGFAWATWLEFWKEYPLLACYLRSKCQWAGKCVCNSNIEFGALFKGCWLSKEEDNKNAQFNESAADIDLISKQLNFKKYVGCEIRDIDLYELTEIAKVKDTKYFEEK